MVFSLVGQITPAARLITAVHANRLSSTTKILQTARLTSVFLQASN